MSSINNNNNRMNQLKQIQIFNILQMKDIQIQETNNKIHLKDNHK